MMKSGFLTDKRRPNLTTAKKEKHKTAAHATSSPATLDPSVTSSSEQEVATSDVRTLPLETILQILTRLPAKSLCRFKCVSKLWKSTISDHRFVTTHHRVSATRREGISVILNVGTMSSGQSMYLLDPERTPDAVHQMTPPIDNVQYLSESVHGLIFLEDGGAVTVVNPSTRSFLRLPPATDPNKSPVGPLTGLLNATYFGYDKVTGEHKLLNTGVSLDQHVQVVAVHKIFVVGSRSWRVIGGPVHIPKKDASVFVNGYIYYRACATLSSMMGERSERDEVLIEFDVHHETFRTLKIPKSALNLHPQFSAVIQLEGRLVIINHTNLVGMQNSVDIWTLEDRVRVKWRRRSVVFGSSEGTKYLKKGDLIRAGTVSSGREIAFARYNVKKPFHLFYLNLKTSSVRKVEVRDLAGVFCNVTVTDHVEHVSSLKV